MMAMDIAICISVIGYKLDIDWKILVLKTTYFRLEYANVVNL